MKPFDIVVCMGSSGLIGIGHQLIVPKFPQDMKHFVTLTSTTSPGKQNAIIMGRKTWKSLPKKPLANRLNVVISASKVKSDKWVWWCSSLETALRDLSQSSSVDRLFVIGGGKLYAEAIHHICCRYLYITRITTSIFANRSPSVWFPTIPSHYRLVEKSGERVDKNAQPVSLTYVQEVWKQ